MLVAEAFRKARRAGLSATLLLALAGCASSRNAQLESSYPLDRVQATVEAADSGDAEAVDRLVTLLEDNDSAVRMYAIAALERLCGESYGYRYYATEQDRAEAIERWRSARQRGEVTVRAGSGTPLMNKAAATPAAAEGSDATQ